jgi:hypothetical protein
MGTKPVGQVHPVEPAGGEVEHGTLLVIDGGVDLGGVVLTSEGPYPERR